MKKLHQRVILYLTDGTQVDTVLSGDTLLEINEAFDRLHDELSAKKPLFIRYPPVEYEE